MEPRLKHQKSNAYPLNCSNLELWFIVEWANELPPVTFENCIIAICKLYNMPMYVILIYDFSNYIFSYLMFSVSTGYRSCLRTSLNSRCNAGCRISQLPSVNLHSHGKKLSEVQWRVLWRWLSLSISLYNRIRHKFGLGWYALRPLYIYTI